MNFHIFKRKLHTLFTDKRILWKKFASSPLFKYLPDKYALKILFKNVFGYSLNLNDPKTFNEKLQWLKLYYRYDFLTNLVDKIAVKEIMANKFGKDFVIPTIGVYKLFEDIDFDKLPQKFVIKTNHAGGNTGVVICTDKSKFNVSAAREKINKSLKSDTYLISREWPYKNIKPLVLIEQYLDTHDGKLDDYKFYCYNGSAESVMVCCERETGHPKFYFFDQDWNLKRYNIRGIEAPDDFSIPKPMNISKMFEIAGELSDGFPFVRVDLYNINGRIYFGELTFFPTGGFDENILEETDKYFGNLIDITNLKQ